MQQHSFLDLIGILMTSMAMEFSFPLLLSTLFLPLLLLLLYKTVGLCASGSRSNLPPSPPKLPLIGNLHQLGAFPHRSIHALAKKHGPVMFLRLGSIDNLVITSAAAAEEILRTKDLVFSSRPQLELARRLLYNCRDVIFSPQGEYWRSMRKICIVHLLSNKKVQSFRPVREDEVSLLVGRVSAAGATPVNLSHLLNNFTSYFIGRIALGKKYADRVDAGGGNTLCRLVKEISEVFGGFYVRDFFPYLAWWGWLSGMDARLDRLSREWDAFLEEVISDHKKSGGGAGAEGDIVDILLALQKDEKEGFALSMEDMKAIIQDMFVAGTDSSYISMEWAMSELIRHPEEMKKVQAEVRAAAAGKAGVDEDDVGRMVYLKAVIKETLRLHPPAVMLVPREPLEDTTVHGYRVPRGTRVLVSVWSVGRDPEKWEDAQEWRPERFMRSSVDFRGYDFHMIPFGAGRRICAGVQFAASTLETALANLLFHFDWKLPDGRGPEDLDMAEEPGFTIRRKSDLLLVATPHMGLKG